MYMQCRHIMTNGVKCRAHALTTKPFCYFHTRLHRISSKKPASALQPLELSVMEDRSAILLGLAQVLNALGSGRLDPKRAGLFLYGLQIASQNVDRRHDILPSETVESLETARNGDEMAPELIVCSGAHDCSTCAERQCCANSEVEDQDEDDNGEEEQDEDSVEEEDEDEDGVVEEDEDENDYAEGATGEHEGEDDPRRIVRPSPASVAPTPSQNPLRGDQPRPHEHAAIH